MEKALNDREAAEFLGVKVQTLRNWRMERRGPVYYKVGKRVIYRQDDLENFLRARRIAPEEERRGV